MKTPYDRRFREDAPMRLKEAEVWIKAKGIDQHPAIDKELSESVRDFVEHTKTSPLKFFHNNFPCRVRKFPEERQLNMLVGSTPADDDQCLEENLTSHVKGFLLEKGLRIESVDVRLRNTEWTEEDLQLEKDYIRISLIAGEKSWNEVLHDSKLPARISSLLLEFMRNDENIKFEGDDKVGRSVVLEEPHGIVNWVQDEDSFDDIYARITEKPGVVHPSVRKVKSALDDAVQLGKLEALPGGKYKKTAK